MSDVKTRIQESIAVNKALVATLTQTDHAPPALEQHKRFLTDLRADLQRSTKNIALYDTQRKSELRDHEGYRDSHFKKFLFKATGQSDKFAERASKEEREYFEAVQKLHNEQKYNDNLKSAVAEAEKALAELEEQTRTNKDAQRRLDELYLSIFTGPTPQFPGDDEREARNNHALQTYHDARVKLEADNQVVQLLQQASADVKMSLGHMEEALSASRLDIFGGGTMADMMERNALSHAERQVASAQMQVLRAQKISDHVSSFPQVRFVEHSILGDVVFDNIFSDLAFHDKLKEGRAEFQKVSAWVNQELAKAIDRAKISAQTLQEKEQELEAARKDLQKFREGVFEQVANGNVAAA